MADFVLAAHELVVNAMAHGDGAGSIGIWQERGSIVCEVRSAGALEADPLADRRRADITAEGGRGLWLANQLCDLVQIRTLGGQVVVRVHLRLQR